MRGLRMAMLVATHVVLVIASVFIMDWVIRDSMSADLWASSHCNGALCFSRPLDDAHATTTIWQTLLFAMIVIWQGGTRAFGHEPSRWLNTAGFMVGAIGAMSVALMAAVFSRGEGLTSAPLVLAGAYVTGFATLRASTLPGDALLATARRVDSARASRRA
jgi:hypothetical protein